MVLAIAATQSVSAASVPRHVSMFALIASPAAFDGQLVVVIGFAHFEFEGDTLCPHEQDHRARISQNCLWLDASAASKASRIAVHNKYAIVEGRFDATDHGHMGMFSGAIRDVSRLELWSREGSSPE